jgi:hypothetical protein
MSRRTLGKRAPIDMHGYRPIRAIENEIRYLQQELAEALAFAAAIKLAYAERTGVELQDGGEYLEVDVERAHEIVLLFPAPGA